MVLIQHQSCHKVRKTRNIRKNDNCQEKMGVFRKNVRKSQEITINCIFLIFFSKKEYCFWIFFQDLIEFLNFLNLLWSHVCIYYEFKVQIFCLQSCLLHTHRSLTDGSNGAMEVIWLNPANELFFNLYRIKI